jgi:hypothetical protein
MTFLQKRLLPPTPLKFIGTNTSHILFLEKEKSEGDNKNTSSFSVNSSSKELPNNENKKKVTWSRMGKKKH